MKPVIMKHVIDGVLCLDHPNMGTWEPNNPDDFTEHLIVYIGAKGLLSVTIEELGMREAATTVGPQPVGAASH